MELTVRRRADALDAALSSGVPAPRGELDRELGAVVLLERAAVDLAPAPSAEFRDALRGRLLAVAAVQGLGETASAPAPAPRPAWRSRAATVVAGVSASVVAVSGVSVAASSSVPGDPFYGVKRTAEDVQLRLADGAHEQGERHLQFAETRLREARELTDRPDLLVPTLGDMDEDTRAGLRLLTEEFRASRDASPLQRLARFADGQRAGLSALLPTVADAARERVRESLALVSTMSTQADDLLLLVDCTAACDPTAAAPALPGGADAADCACPTPPPAPSVAPAPTPSGPGRAPTPGPSGAPSPAPSSSGGPAPASPSPSSSGGPLPDPLSPLDPVLEPLDPVTEPLEPVLQDPLEPLEPLTDPLSPVPVPPLTGSGGLLDGAVDGLVGVAPALVSGGPAAVLVRWLRSVR